VLFAPFEFRRRRPAPKHREHLPQFDGGAFLTDGGFETTLIFHQGRDLPLFAAYPLVTTEDGRAATDAPPD
jgi:hypothetical protein